MDVYKIIWFLDYCNLIEVPEQQPSYGLEVSIFRVLAVKSWGEAGI